MTDTRQSIIRDFAKWTALSALRSGSPIKSRHDVYPLIDAIDFDTMLLSRVTIKEEEFAAWHEREAKALARRSRGFAIGWSTKLLNVYLKTAVYVGDVGRPGLREVLHPPLDGGLWQGLRKRFKEHPEILSEICCANRIRDIEDYRTYRRIINGCRQAAKMEGCTLFELERFWGGSLTPE